MDLNLSAEEALKLFNEQDGGEVAEPEVKAEPEPAPAAEPKAEPEPDQKVQDDAQAEPEGIATNDGKHVIPYSVLKSERARAANAERQIQEMVARVAELEAAVKSGQNPPAKTSDTADTQTTDEDDRLAALEEDFPTVAAELKATRDTIKALQAQIKDTAKSTEAIERERASQEAMTVQEAIDSVPKMAHIPAENAEAFEMAKQFDATLRARPEWEGKPLSERFAKVVELVESTMGAIEVPGLKKPAEPNTTALKAAAEKALAQAPKAVPTSLSQFPAGEPVATDEKSAIETMTHAQIQARFASMTPDQLDAYLAKL